MENDTFRKLFGEENPFEGLFGKSFDKGSSRMPDTSNLDPRGAALLVTFTTEIARGDRSYLERAVIIYKQEVYERENNLSLLEAHAKAALFVENLPLCCESLRKIKNPSPGQSQAIGLVDYNQGNFGLAIKSFYPVKKDLSIPARIAYSFSLLEIGCQEVKMHEEILEPSLKKASVANSILGCLAFNASDYEFAERCLRAAVELDPSSERKRLDLMRVMDINGKIQEVYAQMNSFYIDTSSKLTPEQIIEQIKERKLSVSRAPIKNLFRVVDSLLCQDTEY
jgi:tetratricopeptide (TPR) repeat protein